MEISSLKLIRKTWIIGSYQNIICLKVFYVVLCFLSCCLLIILLHRLPSRGTERFPPSKDLGTCTNHCTKACHCRHQSLEKSLLRTVVFAVFSSKYEFVGACHWTRVTKVWDILALCAGDKEWVVYHNNQRLGTTRCQSIMPSFKLIVLGMMQPWRRLPNLLHRSPVKLLSLLRLRTSLLTPSATTAMWIPIHLSKQGIPSSYW